MLPILQQGLPKAGVIRTFPRVLAHGPLDYRGLDIPHLFMEQIIAHIHTILHYGPDKDDPTSLLLHATAKAMQLELGYGGKLLAAPPLLGDNITNSWIKHMWLSTQECGVTISMDFEDLPLQRHSDVKLMHLFIQNGWKQPGLQTLNQCQMYLKVFQISDIVTGLGNSIAQQFWLHPHLADSVIQWPTMPTPTPTAWHLWRQALTSALNLGHNQRLAIPLGWWFAQTQPNGWYFQPSTISLWEAQGTQWLWHGSIPHQTRQISFHIKGAVMIPPSLSTLEKATISYQNQTETTVDQVQRMCSTTNWHQPLLPTTHCTLFVSMATTGTTQRITKDIHAPAIQRVGLCS